MPRVVGGLLGLTGFATAVFVGIVSDVPAATTLGRALLCMLVCCLTGRALGAMGAAAVEEFVDKYKADRPSPEPPRALVELQDRRDRHKRVVDEMNRAA